jgi:hypothetical protein
LSVYGHHAIVETYNSPSNVNYYPKEQQQTTYHQQNPQQQYHNQHQIKTPQHIHKKQYTYPTANQVPPSDQNKESPPINSNSSSDNELFVDPRTIRLNQQQQIGVFSSPPPQPDHIQKQFSHENTRVIYSCFFCYATEN